MFGYTYLKESTITTPAGLVQNINIGKTYLDSDLNGIPEQVTNTITMNGRLITQTHDVTNAIQIMTSPENRVVTTTYDPGTLLPLTSQVAGLYPVEYSYFADGKVESVTSGDRITQYTYDSQGNLATITDPQNKTTWFTNYDNIGRIRSEERRVGKECRL